MRECVRRDICKVCSRALPESTQRTFTVHGLPLSLVFAFNGSSGTFARLSLCSHLCLTCVDCGLCATLVVGRRRSLVARDNSSAVSSTTSARSRHRRARMIYYVLTWSPNRLIILTHRSDRGLRFPDRHSQTFIFDRQIQWI